MPIKRCKLPGGGTGWQWGSSKCVPTREHAIRIMKAIFASGYEGKGSISEQFKQALASENLLDDKDAIEVLNEIITEEIEEKLKNE